MAASSGAFDVAPTQLIDSEIAESPNNVVVFERDAKTCVAPPPLTTKPKTLEVAEPEAAQFPKPQANASVSFPKKPMTVIAINASETGRGTKFGPSAESHEASLQGLALPPPTEFIDAAQFELRPEEHVTQDVVKARRTFDINDFRQASWLGRLWRQLHGWWSDT